jgi:hypothetical protein
MNKCHTEDTDCARNGNYREAWTCICKTISLVNAEQEQFFSLMLNKQLALPSLHQNSDLQQEATSPTATQSKTEKKKDEKTGYMSR